MIDLIDAELVDHLGWVDDLEFRHPGFPGLQVYRIAHPQLAGTVLHRVGARNRQRRGQRAARSADPSAAAMDPVDRRAAPLARPPPGAGLPEAAPRAAPGWTEPGRGPARAA